MEPGDNNGWNEWSRFVLKTLESMDKDLKAIHKELSLLKVEIAMLKIKASFWGALAGMVPVLFWIIFKDKM